MASGKIDWTVAVKRFAGIEERLPFVALKLVRDRYGFGQEVINEGLELGIFEMHKVPNPGQPYPTTALKLNRSNELVKDVLK